jgi:hypothetical protein
VRLTAQEETALLKEMLRMRGSMFLKQMEADMERTADEIEVCRDETQVRWLQGQRQYIRKIITTIESARGKLDDADKPPTRMQKSF